MLQQYFDIPDLIMEIRRRLVKKNRLFSPKTRPVAVLQLVTMVSTGATTVAMDCPGCVMQIRGGMDQDGVAIKVRHTAELLAEIL